MTTPPLPVAATVPALVMVLAPVAKMSGTVPLPSMSASALLTNVRCASPTVPAPEMMLLSLTNVALVPLLTTALLALFDSVRWPPLDLGMVGGGGRWGREFDAGPV